MVSNVIFRIDDVSANTDIKDFHEQLHLLSQVSEKIILGINIFCKSAPKGSVYPDLPLRCHDRLYFYDIDRIFDFESLPFNKKIVYASHGLVHGMHSQYGRDAIEMSILTSCAILKSKIFIPPFNEISAEVLSVCERNGIEVLMNGEKKVWKSLESESFNPSHKYWYYHPWRINASQLSEILNVSQPV